MKKIVMFLVVLIIGINVITPVYASGNDLQEIEMDVYIHEDGSATINETWKMNAVEATENYKAFTRMGDAYIKDYSVTDENGPYQLEPDWDIDASREEKANKYGIVQNSDGYELCYGIGEYGFHTYTMTYTIVDFIHQYEDAQVMNFRLINDQLDPMPERVNINIKSDILIDDDTADIYAFGFNGKINFVDNGVFVTNALNNGGFGDINYVNVFIGFSDHTFSSANPMFSDRTYNEMLKDAKEGSDYDYDETNWTLVLILMAIIFVIVLVITVGTIMIVRYRRKHFFPGGIMFDDNQPLKKKTEIDPFRDIPCHKDIFMFYYVAKLAKLADEQELKSGLISAILLNWMRSGDLVFVKLGGKKFNRNKYEIDFTKPVRCSNSLEEEMLTFFRKASGSNAILEAKEFERWCGRNYAKLDAWFTKVDIQVSESLSRDGYCYVESSESKFLGFKFPNKKSIYTSKFREELYHVTGFKNFLLEFSSIQEKQVQEVHLWEDYLIFASIIGLAENVEKELGRLYPEFNQNSHLDYTYTTIATRYFIYSGIRRSANAKSAAQMRSSGSGGSSSFGGGGGGFSGGGGGGSR